MELTAGDLEERESKRKVAESIAIKSGALVQCTEHSDVYVDRGDPEALEQAFRIARSRFAGGDASVALYQNPEELIETIKSVVEDTSEECYCCSKFKYE